MYIADIDDLIGIPFIGGGRNIDVGLDCYGLAKEVFRRYGYELPEYMDAVNEWNNSVKTEEFYEQQKSRYWREINSPTVPCLVAISFNVPNGTVNHCGVYIGDGKFIHTRERVGACIESVESPAWRKKIEGYYACEINSNKQSAHT